MFELKKRKTEEGGKKNNNFELKQELVVGEVGRVEVGGGGGDRQRGGEEKYLLIFLTRFMCRFFELISRTMPKGDYLPMLLHICS